MKLFNNRFHQAVCALGLILSCSSFAYLQIGESNEIMALGHYRVGADLQLKTSDGGGTNITGFFDYPLSEETAARALIGVGDTDFYAGGSFKWVPYPDFDSQPALGGKVEGVIGRKGSDSLSHIRIAPMISKRFTTASGDFVPYGALPIGISTYKSATDTAIFVVGGTEYYHPDLNRWSFGGELGFNATKAFSYVSAYATFSFDELPKFQRRSKK